MTDDEIRLRFEELEAKVRCLEEDARRIDKLEFLVAPRWVKPQDLNRSRESCELSQEEREKIRAAVELALEEHGSIPDRKGG